MSAHEGRATSENLKRAFRSPTFDVFQRYNSRGLSDHQVAFLVQAIEEAQAIAEDEWEAPGRIQRSVQREARKLTYLNDTALTAWWYAYRPEGEEDDVPLVVTVLRHEVRQRMWLMGEEPSETAYVDGPSPLRRAINAAAEAAPLPSPSPETLAFLNSIGATPERSVSRGGGPKERVGYDGVMLYLASMFYELTGRPPRYSDTGERPKDTFRGFVDAWIMAPGHRDRSRMAIGTELRMRKAVPAWKKARIQFSFS